MSSLRNPNEKKSKLLREGRLEGRKTLKIQHEFRSLLTKNDALIKGDYRGRKTLRNLEQMKQETDEIQTQLQVAMAGTHMRHDQRQILSIKDQIKDHEEMEGINKKMQNEQKDLRIQIRRVEKQIYDTNLKATSEHQHRFRMERCEKMLKNLENSLDCSRKRECVMITENRNLRTAIRNMLCDRKLFTKLWHRMITQLARDKMFLIDLTERAINSFDEGTDICQKMKVVQKKEQHDLSIKVHEIHNLIRKADANSHNNTFLKLKGQKRQLAELEPREQKRRKIFKEAHREKLTLYNDILAQILQYSGVQTINNAMEKFRDQENIFHAYFNYMNELNFQIEVLNNCVNHLYKNINLLKNSKRKRKQNQKEQIAKLEKQLEVETNLAQSKLQLKTEYDRNMERILDGINDIYTGLRCNRKVVDALLGDHSKVTVLNYETFLRMIGRQLITVLTHVYATERAGTEGLVTPENCIVRGVSKFSQEPPPIDDIVLAQQCSECAKADLINKELVKPATFEKIKKKIREKVFAPEMQKLLHALDECKMPKSRILAGKK